MAGPQAAAGQSAAVATTTAAPLGQIQSTDVMVHGAVEISASGTRVMSGAQITAGTTTSTLKLTRGGEVRFCPGTAVTITASKSGNELMLGLNSGAIETHYQLAGGADALVTPDFRMLLAGPGAFHFAVSVNPRGDTCVASLKDNASAAIVYESMGEGTYQVHPGEQVLFQHGTVKDATKPAIECGCPPAADTVKTAQLAFPEEQSRLAAEAVASGRTPPAPAVTNNVGSGETHMQIETPMVFRADKAPAPAPTAGELRQSPVTFPEFPRPMVQPPSQAVERRTGEKKRWYQKFFAFLKGTPRQN